jgi:hydrogenase nickel incorporation protein HypA/HybF
MHELSVAMGIVRIAEEETSKAGAKRVELIELEIGDLAGIEFDSLDYVWTAAVKGTVLEKAKKTVHRIEGKGVCTDCDHEFSMRQYFDPCPKCESYLKSIVSGKELRVKALEVV